MKNANAYFLAFFLLFQTCCISASEVTSQDIRHDQSRITESLLLVYKSLQHLPTDDLNDHQIRNRKQALSHLKEYISNGVFPINKTDTRKPVFKDHTGTWCAVGYLLVATGSFDLAEHIAKENNFIYIDSINHFNDTALGQWAHVFGFSQSELALIQPTYDFYGNPSPYFYDSDSDFSDDDTTAPPVIPPKQTQAGNSSNKKMEAGASQSNPPLAQERPEETDSDDENKKERVSERQKRKASSDKLAHSNTTRLFERNTRASLYESGYQNSY